MTMMDFAGAALRCKGLLRPRVEKAVAKKLSLDKVTRRGLRREALVDDGYRSEQSDDEVDFVASASRTETLLNSVDLKELCPTEEIVPKGLCANDDDVREQREFVRRAALRALLAEQDRNTQSEPFNNQWFVFCFIFSLCSP